MAAKKSDFNLDEYTSKVTDAHDKLKSLETRIQSIEEITEDGLFLKMFKKNSELREEMEKLIWKTIINKAFMGFLYLCGAVVIIPLFSKIFSFLVLKILGVSL